MPQGFSAYLSIYNDWDILPDALRSIAPYVDEIVLVDGAYEWMLPYFEAMGTDPRQSDARVREAAAQCGVRLRIVTGIWKNEIEKRMAGYAACSGRHVFRFDADEILLIHEERLARFVAEGGAVAAMEMPICVAPGHISVAGPDAPLERQCLLFDKQRITAAVHLRYLWLVLGPDRLPPVDGDMPPIFPEAIAFNSHLTGWRTPATSRFRASFYTLNYVRTHGMPWTAWVRGTAVRDLSVLFSELVSPAIYHDMLLTGSVVVGEAEPRGKELRASPYGTAGDPHIHRLFENYLASLAALNRETAATGRHFINGEYVLLDLSTDAATDALAIDGSASGTAIVLIVPSLPVKAIAKLYVQLTEAPWEALTDAPHVIAHDRLTIHLPEKPQRGMFVRRILRLQIWCAKPGPIQTFAVARA